MASSFRGTENSDTDWQSCRSVRNHVSPDLVSGTCCGRFFGGAMEFPDEEGS